MINNAKNRRKLSEHMVTATARILIMTMETDEEREAHIVDVMSFYKFSDYWFQNDWISARMDQR